MEKPTGKKPPTAFPKTLEIERTDFHIPSAPAATLTAIQKPERSLPQFACPSLPSGSSFDWKRLPTPVAKRKQGTIRFDRLLMGVELFAPSFRNPEENAATLQLVVGGGAGCADH
jgi:hypothetical protein